MILRHNKLGSILLLVLLLVESVLGNIGYYNEKGKYMVRKGGRLERLQKRTLQEWKHVSYHPPRRHRNKRRRHERAGGSRIDHILAQMDSFVRPRFGRAAGFNKSGYSNIKKTLLASFVSLYAVNIFIYLFLLYHSLYLQAFPLTWFYSCQIRTY
uniref:Uncharacterized protein n=1 Tax=Heterorhabditis bacteriophora TaxID=37862 RepID=A0A1I7WJ92_HETBA